MATQSFYCVLCQENFTTVQSYNLHEKDVGHRREFERRMDCTSVGLLLCKCCFISVPDWRMWEDHIRSKGHVKLVGQSEFLGKKCVWDVPGIKMEDGSIKLCKNGAELNAAGWKDPGWTEPGYKKKLDNTHSRLETDIVIGMNCVSLKGMNKGFPLYYCSLCSLEFHHNDRHHMTGRHHKINVIWNWEKETADRISKGLDFPKNSTKLKAQQELAEVTDKIYKLEQDCLNDKQYELYLVISNKRLPSELGKNPVSRVPLRPPESALAAEPPLKKAREFLGDPSLPVEARALPFQAGAPPPRSMPSEGLLPPRSMPSEGLLPPRAMPSEGLLPPRAMPSEGLLPPPGRHIPPSGHGPHGAHIPPSGVPPNIIRPAGAMPPLSSGLLPHPIGQMPGPIPAPAQTAARPHPGLPPSAAPLPTKSLAAFTATIPQSPGPPQQEFPPHVQTELDLFNMMEELQESGNFNPPAPTVDPAKLLKMLHTLGEGLLEFQTKKREIPMELSREHIQSISTSVKNIEDTFRGLRTREKKKSETAA